MISRPAVARRPSTSHRHIDLAEVIVYLCALIIAHQPRAIDRYIDYFGESSSPPSRGLARAHRTPVLRPARSASSPAMSLPLRDAQAMVNEALGQ